MKIILRSETKPLEHRTPLTPEGAKWLIQNTQCTIYVESSSQRIFKDSDYEKVGCSIVKSGFWKNSDSNTLVIGLKELENDDTQLKQAHIYFAHAYRSQLGSTKLLKRFYNGGGALLDLEYLTDLNNQRLISFGFWAGYIGAALSLMIFLKPSIKKLNYWPHRQSIKEKLKELIEKSNLSCQKLISLPIAITGALGRAGQGAHQFFKEMNMRPSLYDLGDLETDQDKQRLLKAHIIVHCVGATKRGNFSITEKDLKYSTNLKVLSDVTCDFTSDHHMFPFYKTGTSFLKPTILCQGVSIIAIDHLPSLLPLESSRDFGKIFQHLLHELLVYGLSNSDIWNRTHLHYTKALKENLELELT